MEASSALIMSAAERAAVELFTPDDLAAADQLVQLSVSGDARDACSSSSQLSSPRSVNNAAAGAAVAAAAAAVARDQDGEEEGEGGGGCGDDNNAEGAVVDRRVRKRYRLVSELYAATRRVDQVVLCRDGGGNKRKSKQLDGVRMDGRIELAN